MFVSGKYVEIEVNAEHSKCMCFIREEVRLQHLMKRVSQFSESVTRFKCLGRTTTVLNFMYDEVASRITSGTVCYHSLQNRLFSVCYLKM